MFSIKQCSLAKQVFKVSKKLNNSYFFHHPKHNIPTQRIQKTNPSLKVILLSLSKSMFLTIDFLLGLLQPSVQIK